MKKWNGEVVFIAYDTKLIDEKVHGLWKFFTLNIKSTKDASIFENTYKKG